jgi:hypothetical protein
MDDNTDVIRFKWLVGDTKSCLQIEAYCDGGIWRVLAKPGGHLRLTRPEWDELKAMIDELFEANDD